MTNLNYLLISGPLKRNMSLTNDLSSSFMWGVLFSDSDDKSTPRLQWVYICSSWRGCFTFAAVRCSAGVQHTSTAAAELNLDVLRLSRPAEHCSAAVLPQTHRNFWPGCLQQLPQNCRTLGHLQCRSLYIARVTGERESKERQRQ